MFISSSEPTLRDRSPCKAWIPGWLGALVLAAAFVGGVEAFWRTQGFQPDVPDTRELWSFWRDRANRSDGRVVVLLGTSRMKADIDIDTLRGRLPGYSVVQLAIVGDEGPIGILRQMALDEEFRGIVLCGMMAPLFHRSHWHDHREYTGQKLDSRRVRNTVCLSLLQSQLVALNPRLGAKAVAARWLEAGELPQLDFKRQTFSRGLQYDFARARSLQVDRQKRAEQYRRTYASADTSEFVPTKQDYQELNELVKQLRKRGGDVVFVRLPSSGERWELEEEHFPKSGFWDPFSRSVDAACIHFLDSATLAGFVCPDDSHLGQVQAASFTEAILDEVFRMGLPAL